jgi:glycosyltransferase involved in cell wall biosynthesis
MAPLVVLHVLEALEGGTARHLVDIARHAAGVEHHAVIPGRRVGGVTDERAEPGLRAAGATVHIVAMRRNPLHPENADAVRRVRRLVADLGPAVVHGHSTGGGAIARLATPAGTPRVHTPNGILPSRPVVAFERALGRRTDRLVAVSPSEADRFRQLRLAPADRIVTIPNGIDLTAAPASDVDLRATLGLEPGTPLVGTICRLVHQKDPETFVAAMGLVCATHPAAHAVLIGDGPRRREVARLVERLRLGDRLHVVPSLPGAAGVLGQLDVFVLASRFEGLPYSPLEALRAGTPVVLTDAVGNRDVVEDGRSGLLVPVGDAAAVAAACGRLLADPGLAARLAEAGRARVAERFDVRAAGAELTALYEDLTSGT